MNILLCGLPLSGKSFVGALVAKQLNWGFIDTDQSIENLYQVQTGQIVACRDIFRQRGESIFRQLEHQVISSLLSCQKQVIALGGGALTFSANLELIKEMGILIYLEVEPEILVKRLLKKTELPAYLNPSAPVESFNEIVKQRKLFYEIHSHLKVATKGLSMEQVITCICMASTR